jgi:predicted nucleotide-binding protein (sugar kinase/HSP70/actin superfamily)
MKVTFPQLGTLAIGIRALLDELGADYVTPPPTTSATIARGAALAPESACLPLKIGLGNFLAAEELGAEAVLMAGGCGPCRLGYYADVERSILNGAGSKLEVIILQTPRGHVGDIWTRVKRFAPRATPTRLTRGLQMAWVKLNTCDEIDRLTDAARAGEARSGSATALRRSSLAALDAAGTLRAVRRVRADLQGAFAALPQRAGDDEPPIHCGLLGEVFVVLEPGCNHDVERRLGELGVLVDRSVMLTDWVREALGRDLFRLGRLSPAFQRARPYLNHWVGGHGTDNVGETVRFARAGYDGAVHVAPLTCMPEIVAHNVLRGRVTSAEDIPVLTLYFDEHAAEAGTVTRLEAFVDLMRRRRRARQAGVSGGNRD